MILNIRRAFLLSLTGLAILALSPQLSYGADSSVIPTDPVTGPKQSSSLNRFFGACLGCVSATQDVVEDVQEISTVVVSGVEQVIDQVDKNDTPTSKGVKESKNKDDNKDKGSSGKESKKDKKKKKDKDTAGSGCLSGLFSRFSK